MKVKDHNKFRFFDYEQYWNGKTKLTDRFKLGDVVKNKDGEIGVIIQCHGQNEYRTDMFGNCDETEIRLAVLNEIYTRMDVFDAICIS